VHDLITEARENPGKLTYGHAGTGTIPHLAVENFAEALKLKFQAVPFRGDAPVLPTLLKGDIDFGAPPYPRSTGRIFAHCWYFGRPGTRPIRTCRSHARLAPPARYRPAITASTRRADCRSLRRRRWSGIAPMP